MLLPPEIRRRAPFLIRYEVCPTLRRWQWGRSPQERRGLRPEFRQNSARRIVGCGRRPRRGGVHPPSKDGRSHERPTDPALQPSSRGGRRPPWRSRGMRAPYGALDRGASRWWARSIARRETGVLTDALRTPRPIERAAQSTTSSQCSSPSPSPATRRLGAMAASAVTGASSSRRAVSAPVAASHSRIVLS